MKPNEPIRPKHPDRTYGCKSGKCRPRKESLQEFIDRKTAEITAPRKESVRIQSAEIEQCGGKPKSIRIELPEPMTVGPNDKIELHKVGDDIRITKNGAPVESVCMQLAGMKALVGDCGIDKIPGGHLFRHGLDTGAPVKNSMEIVNEDQWHKDTQYHCKRCDKDVIDNRCECLSSPSPWEPKHYDVFDGKWLRDSNLLWAIIAALLAFLIGYHLHMTAKLDESHKQFDELLDEYYKAPLPQGDGEIPDRGVLPEKGSSPSGKLDMRMIISTAIMEIEETPYF